MAIPSFTPISDGLGSPSYAVGACGLDAGGPDAVQASGSRSDKRAHTQPAHVSDDFVTERLSPKSQDFGRCSKTELMPARLPEPIAAARDAVVERLPDRRRRVSGASSRGA